MSTYDILLRHAESPGMDSTTISQHGLTYGGMRDLVTVLQSLSPSHRRAT